MKTADKKFAVAGRAKDLSPLVLIEVVKKYGKYAADLATVHIVRDEKKLGLLHITMDAVGRKHPQPFDIYTASWDRLDPVHLMFLEAEGYINLIEEAEIEHMADMHLYDDVAF